MTVTPEHPTGGIWSTRAFPCQVMVPDGAVFHAEAVSVVFPALDGLVGVLARRAPLVAALGAGLLRIRAAKGGTTEFFVVGGFAHVYRSGVSILAEDCQDLDRIDPEQAYGQIEQASRMPRTPPEAAENRRTTLLRARARFNLAQKRRRAKGAPGRASYD